MVDELSMVRNLKVIALSFMFCMCLFMSHVKHSLLNIHMSRYLYIHIYTHTYNGYGNLWSHDIFSKDILLSYVKRITYKIMECSVFSHQAQLAHYSDEETEAKKAHGFCS